MSVTAGRIPKIKSVSSEGTQVEDDIRASQIRDTMDVVGGKLVHSAPTLFNGLAEFISGIQASQITVGDPLLYDEFPTLEVYGSNLDEVRVTRITGGSVALEDNFYRDTLSFHVGSSDLGIHARIEVSDNTGGRSYNITEPSGNLLTSASTLPAANVTGVLAAGNIPNLPASKITSGTFNVARIPATIARVADEDAREANAGLLYSRKFVPHGGVRTEGSTAQTARFWVPDYVIDLSAGDTEVSFFIEDEAEGSKRIMGCGFASGWGINATASSITVYVKRAGSHLIYAEGTWPRSGIFVQRTHVAATIKNILTTPVLELFINGVSQGSKPVTPTGEFSPPTSGSLTFGADIPTGVNVGNGTYSCVQVFNCILTPEERMSIVSSGGAVVPVPLRGAEDTPRYQSNFAASPDGWILSTLNSSLQFGQTVAGETNCLLITAHETAASIGQMYRTGMGFVRGQKYRFSLRIYVPTTNATLNNFYAFTNAGAQLLNSTVSPAERGQWVYKEQEVTFTYADTHNTDVMYARPRVRTDSTPMEAGDWIAIKDFKVEAVGAVLDLPCDDGNGVQLRDRSGNGRHALLGLSGCDHLIPKTSGLQLSQRGVNVTSGAVYLLGDIPVLPAGAIVTHIRIGEELHAADTGNQYSPDTYTRIRCLQNSGGSFEVQRSNGVNHETLAVDGASTTFADVAILYDILIP